MRRQDGIVVECNHGVVLRAWRVIDQEPRHDGQVIAAQGQAAYPLQCGFAQPCRPVGDLHALQAQMVQLHIRETEPLVVVEAIAAEVEVAQWARGQAFEVQWEQGQVLVDEAQVGELREARVDLLAAMPAPAM